MYRLALTAFLLLAFAAPAGAAEISLGISPSNGLQLGGEHRFSGILSNGGMAQPGEVVTLEARRFPFEGGFTALAQATTGDRGQFVFFQELDRNHEIRVTAADGSMSQTRVAFVFPRFRLSFRSLGGNRIRLTQRYSTPDDVALTERTHFYLGPRKGKVAPRRARASTRQTGAGRFVATAVVRIPRAYKGRFRYASCIPGDPAAGMGDPSERCGRRFRF